jgi:hypothetical protein
MRPSALALLAAFAASPAVAQAPQVAIPLEIACRGDAPYWQLDAGRSAGTLKRTGGKAKQQLELRGELTTVDGVAPPALVWRGSSTHLPAEVVVLTARELACTAGDKAAGWQAIASLRTGETLPGCCAVRRGYDATKAPLASFAAKPATDWSRRYQELSTSIQRCVNDGGVTVREVAKAWSVDADTVHVRMTGVDGKAWQCTAAGRAKPKVAPVAASDPAPEGANAPVYYPPRAEPIVACGKLERIAAAGPRARTEGWLHYERC